MSFLTAFLSFVLLQSAAIAGECPELGKLDQTSKFKKIGAEVKHPVGFALAGMNSSLAYVGTVSRNYYRKGAASRVVRATITFRKRHPLTKEKVERVLKKREKRKKYRKLGMVTKKGFRTPLYKYTSRSGRVKFKFYYPYQGKYISVDVMAEGKEFPDSCKPKFEEFAKALAVSIK